MRELEQAAAEWASGCDDNIEGFKAGVTFGPIKELDRIKTVLSKRLSTSQFNTDGRKELEHILKLIIE